jgi:putative ABC transport system ATP-binding protein
MLSWFWDKSKSNSHKSEEEIEKEKQLSSELPFQKELGEVVVTVQNIFKHYKIPGRSDNVRALEDINLHDESEFYGIRRGEFVMIRGPSGGGKTTLLSMYNHLFLLTN